MGEANHEITFLILLQFSGNLVGCGVWVKILHSLYVLLHHKALDFWCKSKHSYFQTLTLYDDIRLYQPLTHCPCKVAVGAHQRKLRHLCHSCEILNAEVKLVVAQRSRVISHHVHQSHFHVASEQRVVG